MRCARRSRSPAAALLENPQFVSRTTRLLDTRCLATAQDRIALVQGPLVDSGWRKPMLFVHLAVQPIDGQRVTVDDLMNL
jgi:hypothetical protein